jgi:hypothetical protein
MVLVYINFLSSVQANQQACNSQLQAARKLQTNWCDRCASPAVLSLQYSGWQLSTGIVCSRHVAG